MIGAIDGRQLDPADGPAEHEQAARGDPASSDAYGDACPVCPQLNDERCNEHDQHDNLRRYVDQHHDLLGHDSAQLRRQPLCHGPGQRIS